MRRSGPGANSLPVRLPARDPSRAAAQGSIAMRSALPGSLRSSTRRGWPRLPAPIGRKRPLEPGTPRRRTSRRKRVQACGWPCVRICRSKTNIGLVVMVSDAFTNDLGERGSEVCKKPQVPLFDRQRGLGDWPERRTATVGRISGIELDRLLVHAALVVDIVRVEPGARLEIIEHRLLALKERCRG